jgi:hypothetical protein
MITSVIEYERAQEELRDLEERLRRLQRESPLGIRGFTKAGVHKMISRLHEELALFEGGQEARKQEPRETGN